MKLDFTFTGKIEPQYTILFNKIAFDIQMSFSESIDSISKQHANSIDWWVSSPASRNTFTSFFFYYCCCIALLQELISRNEQLTEIITDSKAFQKILMCYLAKQRMNIKVTLVRISIKGRLIKIARPIWVAIGIPVRQLLLFLAARYTHSLRKIPPSKPLTLIDTFTMRDYIEKDRYYPGMVEQLPEEDKQLVWFVPHIHDFRPWEYLSVIKRLRKAERNFLLKEDYLKFVDYWCLWGHIFRIHNLRIKSSFFRGIDISHLVLEELKRFRNIGCSYAPLLNYRFSERLKKAGIKLKLVVDWFENQDIDKGWNAGFRRFFPYTEVIGYQGFMVSSHYLCKYPTVAERDSNVIPHKVAVIGQGIVQSAKKFCADLNVCIAPAFRFQHVWLKRKYFPDEARYTILAALPIMINDAFNILMSLAAAVDGIADDIHVWIKPHPTASQSQIKTSFGSKWPAQFEFVDVNFSECVEKANLLVSSASSVCTEALAKGIPVLVVGNNFGLTQNPIPETITSDIWRMCYSAEEIKRAIHFYKNRSTKKIEEHEEVGRLIKAKYFEPVTKESITRFLNLKEKYVEREL